MRTSSQTLFDVLQEEGHIIDPPKLPCDMPWCDGEGLIGLGRVRRRPELDNRATYETNMCYTCFDMWEAYFRRNHIDSELAGLECGRTQFANFQFYVIFIGVNLAQQKLAGERDPCPEGMAALIHQIMLIAKGRGYKSRLINTEREYRIFLQ